MDRRPGFGSQTHEGQSWIVETHTAPISKDTDVEELKNNLAAPNLPEQLFGSSFLRLTHQASGLALEFNAADALQRWHEDNEPPVQVAIASTWQSTRKEAVAKVAALHYDWTYSTSYAGTLRHAPKRQTDGAPTVGTITQLSPRRPAVPRFSEATSDNSVSGAEQAAAEAQLPQWQTSGDSLDMTLLTARDPIQFYAEVPLYESELDDNGTSQLSVKVRVMPGCWYALLRFFLRVDGTLVRMREARLFCDLKEPNKVVREVKHSESTLAQLSGNAPADRGVAHRDADSAALALSAIAPDGVKEYRIDTLCL
mmetsp:Transcript_181/g.524  ORF Transcript_181/g.524 Transcript_181/m.524 type:complete len:311 (-) Transcript_181:171-1103(-)|eukprot:CAMPEP_0206143926 /NCGR_PEP_ID=MMETSP1473-20131121/22397_1 /ASSEMBLY_ACC=CAM_ASM_001109 /TAXON_ID=1461547 /ORGANISM="Stichococcus sp, Strain RCC1054" /LENGTH=310 /DNA_ID=CAMNT_0053539561 /DNA_START=151 /DNA_END=1083 /DNA_ORIENTATION=-